jgi:hypothetical protein
MRISRERFVLSASAALCTLSATPAGAAKVPEPIPGCIQPPVPGPGPPGTIMLIRHAEKPTNMQGGVDTVGESDPNSLRIEGWERAGALVRFFAEPTSPGIMTPTALFAGAYQKAKHGVLLPDTKSVRPFHTLSPLAARLNLPIDACFPTGDEAGLAAVLLRVRGGVLVAWEHNHIPAIAAALPVRNPRDVPARWPGQRYDIVFLFRLSEDGKTYVFSQVPQLALPGDSEVPLPPG